METLRDYLITEEDIQRAKRVSRQIAEEYGESISWLDVVNIREDYVMHVLAGRSANLLRVSGLEEFIAKPTKVRVDEGGLSAEVKYPNNVYATYIFRAKEGIDRLKEFSDLINNYHYVVRKNGNKWVVSKIIKVGVDTEGAEKVIVELGIKKAIGLTLGLSEKGVETYWWRIIPLLFDSGHVLEISTPGSGKTHYSLILSRFYQFAYFTEPPTLARLIFDAATREYGELYTSKGLILDEFDKYASKDRQRFKELYGVLLTGMEQGEWVRGARGFARLNKSIPIIMFGNMNTEMLIRSDNAYDSAQNFLGKTLKVDVEPLLTRLTLLVIGDSSELKIKNDYISNVLLKPAVARGVISILRQKAETIHDNINPPAEMDVRMSRRYRILISVMKLLDIKNDEKEIVEKGLIIS